MYKNKKILAVITARGGSKGVPRKNIKLLNGKPLITYVINSALHSKLIDRVIVSTDDPEIAKVAKKYGAEVPFLRPAELSIATIGIEPTLKHAYQWLLDNEGYKADALALLMPTSPLRQTFHIDDSIKIFTEIGCSSSARVDFILDESENAFMLEINSLPGMTDTSDLPAQAKAAGIEYEELVEIILKTARLHK